MHFAVGMASGTIIAGLGCLVVRRGWRWIPAAMTLGGLWALVPDMPRLFREDFPSLPFATTLGSKAMENKLHSMGDWFFFHEQLDAQPNEYALLGFIGILVLYNFALFLMMILEHGQRHSIIHRAHRAHRGHQDSRYAMDLDDDYPEMYTTYLPPPMPPMESMGDEPLQLQNPSDPVIGRIGKDAG